MSSADLSRPTTGPTANHAVLANGERNPAHHVTEDFDHLPDSIGSLLRVLDADYGYTLNRFVHRATALSLPTTAGGPALDALSFDVSLGFPFFLAVACSESSCTTHREAAIRHALDTATIGIIFLYDRTTDYREVFRRDFREGRFDAAPGLPPYSPQGNNRQFCLFNVHAADEGDSGRASQLPITHKLEGIFFEMHSIMRDEDGLHADEALEELCKLLHLKMSIESNNTPIDITSARSCEEKSALLRGLHTQSLQMDIPTPSTITFPFSKPIGLSTSALLRAFSLLEDYTLSGTHTDVKGRAFQKVLTKAARAGMGQYFTPAPVVEMMVEIVEPSSSESIVDPFCGSGHFLIQSLARLEVDLGKACNNLKLHGIEKSDRMASIAITELSLSGCPANIRTADALIDFDRYDDIRPESFDVVLTNPPFGSILGIQAFSSLAKFNLAKGRKRLPLEVAGLERCAELLRPGGRLAIVLPESIFSATSFRYVRTWLRRIFSIRVVVDLPSETFCPFGANVRSGILFARKRHCRERVDDQEKVNMIRVENVGYDASGRTRAGTDIALAVKEAKQFLAAEGW